MQLPVESLECVRRAQAPAMRLGHGEDGEALGYVRLHPLGELGRRPAVLVDELREPLLRFAALGGVEHGA